MNYQTAEKLNDIAACIRGDEKVSHLFSKYKEETLPLLEHHGLGTLIYENQNLKENSANIEATIIKEAKASIAMAVANESLKFSEFTKIVDSLTDAGLDDFVIFKGWALAYSVYEKPWFRPRTDIDILVEHSEVIAYHELLIANGFKREFAIEGDLISYQSGYSKPLSQYSTIYIDLHWRVSNRQCIASAFDVKEIIRNATQIKGGIPNFKTPSKADSILLACQHRLGHHHREERLIWLYDIHLLAESFDDIEWSDFLKKTKKLKLAHLSYDALNSSEALFSTEVPRNVIEALTLQKKEYEPSALFLNRSLSNWQILKSDVSALDGLLKKCSFIKQTAFPSQEYIKEKMATKSAFWGYLKRAYLGFYRMFAND